MWWSIFSKEPSKKQLIKRLNKIYDKVNKLNKHLPDISKMHDMVLNDLKFDLSVQLLRLRGKASSLIDDLKYDKEDIESFRSVVPQYEKEFVDLNNRVTEFIKKVKDRKKHPQTFYE